MPSRWVVINTFVDLLCLRQTVVIRWFLRFSKREVLLVILNRKVIVQVWLWGGESGLTLRDALVHFRPAASVINIFFLWCIWVSPWLGTSAGSVYRWIFLLSSVGNKNDDPSKRQVDTQDALRFGESVGVRVFETSAKENINVEEVKL